jgi:hypothetical protein
MVPINFTDSLSIDIYTWQLANPAHAGDFWLPFAAALISTFYTSAAHSARGSGIEGATSPFFLASL